MPSFLPSEIRSVEIHDIDLPVAIPMRGKSNQVAFCIGWDITGILGKLAGDIAIAETLG